MENRIKRGQRREINMEEEEGRWEAWEKRTRGEIKMVGNIEKKTVGGERNGGDEDKERLGKRGGENDPKTQWSSMPPRKIGLWSPLTISKLRATLPTYPA